MAGPVVCGRVPTITVRAGKGSRSRLVPAHPELVDTFRSVPRSRVDDKVFQFSPRPAARWITQGIAAPVATGTGVKGPGSHSLRHSCVRHWLQSGLNVSLFRVAGHSSPTVTLNTYLVLAPDTLGDISEVP